MVKTRWPLANHRSADMVAQPSVASSLSAQSESVLIEDLTWTEVRDAIAAGKTTAIYYAGSTGQNGPHMALGNAQLYRPLRFAAHCRKA
jgi:hypothetical protein